MKRTLILVGGVLSACSPSEPNTQMRPVTAEYQVMATNPSDQPEELGKVSWLRDYNAAIKASKKANKPIFLLFTEVPGCSTVKGFANGPLSDPLVVDAIQHEFIPLAIYNNTSGDADAKILKKFDEPSWNNPVVRFIDSNGEDVRPRYSRGWKKAGLLKAMVEALDKTGGAPDYLKLTSNEANAKTKTAMFSMYCFWTGEVKFAGLEGVVATRPGFAAGREVVEVTYDPKQTTLSKLASDAAEVDAASGFMTNSDTDLKAVTALPVLKSDDAFRYSAKDDKYQIRGTNWQSLNLTPAQATALNLAKVSQSKDARQVLSPTQRNTWK